MLDNSQMSVEYFLPRYMLLYLTLLKKRKMG